MRHLFRLGLAVLFLGLVYLFWSSRPIRYPAGVLVAEDPVQQEEPAPTLPDVAGFHLTPVAHYFICARVLGTKRYWDPPAAKLVPMDVALGWGPMSDQAVLDRLGISMGNRFFFYQWRNAPPIAPDEIMRHAANNHVIPATPEVQHAIKGLRSGEIVRLEGWLVDAVGPHGYTWNTSRRRDDTGKGACELFYVEAMETVPPGTATAQATVAARGSE